MSSRVIAVTGSRQWKDSRLLFAVLDRIRPEPTMIVHGGAVGADTYADYWAANRGIERRAIEPDYRKHGKAATFVRNREIVDAADEVIAFRSPGKSNGTDYTIRYAKERGKLREIVNEPSAVEKLWTPTGTVTHE